MSTSSIPSPTLIMVYYRYRDRLASPFDTGEFKPGTLTVSVDQLPGLDQRKQYFLNFIQQRHPDHDITLIRLRRCPATAPGTFHAPPKNV